MIIYHGSDVIIDKLRIISPNRPLDFGGGFYLTTDYEQATKWAKKVALRNATHQFCINKYEIDIIKAKENLEYLEFDKADEKWLDFICSNRQGNGSDNYDIIIGPVADDRVYKVVVEYENKSIDKDMTLKELKVEKLCNQLLFHTEKALSYLRYLGTEIVTIDG